MRYDEDEIDRSDEVVGRWMIFIIVKRIVHYTGGTIVVPGTKE
mgnify:CR=1 FL=1